MSSYVELIADRVADLATRRNISQARALESHAARYGLTALEARLIEAVLERRAKS